MNAIYSLCTKTPNFVFREVTLLLATLSMLEAKKNFAHVRFYGDETALDTAGMLGWSFDDCVLVKPDDWPLATWAYGKLNAIKQECLKGQPFVHLDLDVVVQQPIDLGAKPLIAQSIDHESYYRSATMLELLRRAKLPKGAVAYNCGIVGGSDLQFLYHWAIEGMSLARIVDAPQIDGTAASMMVEQYLLGLRARRANLRVKELLSYPAESNSKDFPGYHHFVGGSKSSERTRRIIAAKMKLSYPEQLEFFNSGVTALRRRHKVR